MNTKINDNHNTISNANVTKFFGLTIENNLSWRTHLDRLSLKLGKVCYVIRTVKSYMSQEVLVMIYYAYFHSVLSYSIIFWGNSPHSIDIFRLRKKRLLELFVVYIIESHVETYFAK
jgi:hypothetical protein